MADNLPQQIQDRCRQRLSLEREVEPLDASLLSFAAKILGITLVDGSVAGTLEEPRQHQVDPFEIGKPAFVFPPGEEWEPWDIFSLFHGAPLYPCPNPPPSSDGDWVHDPDRQAWTSAKHKATVLSNGSHWWVRLGDDWLKADDGGVREFVSAHAAKRTVAELRAKERA